MDITAIKNRIGLSKNNNKVKDKPSKKAYKISIRLNTTLHDTLHNYLSALHASADYSYGSVADILRHILINLEDGKLKLNNIKAPVSDNNQIEFTIRCHLPQKQFWQTLPSGNKVHILEKAIIAFLQK